MPVFALTIFIGAFLLFQVQPLIGKYILPWFGGGTGIWTACLLFFQALLLGGYAYAHFSSRWLKPRHQATVHLVLLATALALLPITPADAWKPTGDGNPTLQILALLTVCLGLPYFVLSATGPLMQHWFSCTHPGVSPYRLYALSNAGSLLALISYPIYFETHFTRTAQARLWGWGLAVYAVACGFCVIKLWKAQGVECRVSSDKGGKSEIQNQASAPLNSLSRRSVAKADQPSTFSHLLWLLLPACASVLLLATTNKICQDVAVIPFLWVLPLALYLLSFIICFDNPRWYARFPFTLALVAALGGICWAIFRGYSWPIGKLVTVHAGGMFVCCMVCHGELYRLRPDPRHLTGFYLMIAAGGALGGLFVAVIAPMIFTGYYELHIGVLLCALLFLTACLHDRNPAEVSQWRWMSWTLPLLGIGRTQLVDDIPGRRIWKASQHPFHSALSPSLDIFNSADSMGNPVAQKHETSRGCVGFPGPNIRVLGGAQEVREFPALAGVGLHLAVGRGFDTGNRTVVAAGSIHRQNRLRRAQFLWCVAGARSQPG
ncbi:MAG: hypothetical protein ABSH15_07975 [Verrucomicrobiota bacterium]|jgi:hypothetical protein